MKKLLTIFFAVSIVVIFSQCRIYYGKWKVYFWTSTSTTSASYLYIDDVYKGELPYLREAPECGNESSRKNALYVKLESGKYDIKVKDKSGNTTFTEKLTIKRSRGSVTIATSRDEKTGGSRNVSEGDCLAHEIYFE